MRHLDSLSNKANRALEVADDSGGDTLWHHLSSPGWWQEGGALLTGLASGSGGFWSLAESCRVSMGRGWTLKIKRLLAAKPAAAPTEPPRRILGS